jgi:hypothetical protein
VRYTCEAEIARDALLIFDGASNPQGIARALVDAIDWYVENRGGTDGAKQDNGSAHPPLVLMQAHLLFLLGMGVGDIPAYNMWQMQEACKKLEAKEAS